MFRNCVFFMGVVENNVDPLKRGRVQVRVFGAHDIYNPPMTDAQGRTAWGAAYGGGVGGGSMPQYSANGNAKLLIWQRYNNPMNLKNTDGTWRRFDDISQAYPAYKRQLAIYQNKYHLMTPRQMIARWAPAKENNLANYYATVTGAGVGIDTPIDMNNDEQVAVMLRGMTIMESGNRFSVQDIISAMNGNIVPSMTAVSTVYKDGQLYTGTSNVAEGIAGSSGQMPVYSSGISGSAETNKQAAMEEAKKQQEAQPDKNTEDKKVQVEQKPAEATAPPTKSPDMTGHQLMTEDLPWAVCLYSPVEYGGTSYSTLPAPQVQNGAMVFGMSIDGDFMNQLFILGIIPTITNIDALSTNPNEVGANSVGGSLSGLGNMAGKLMPTGNSSTQLKTNSGMTFDQLQNGIWNGESGKGTNKKTSSAYAYGTMQVMPALAADYLLSNSSGSLEALKAAGWELDEDTINMLKEIRYGNGGKGYWGSSLQNLIDSNPKVADFCNLLQENDALNMAIGTAYLRDCASPSQGNGDPVLTALYYNQGIPNTHKILDAIGVTDYNNLPTDQSYRELAGKIDTVLNKAGQKNNFTKYLENIFAETGGLDVAEQNRAK